MKQAPPRTYVYSGLDGIFYARCSPPKTGHPARTQVFRVEEKQDMPVDSYEFFSPRIELGWSPIAGKVAVLATRLANSADLSKQHELDFYLGGKHLKTYSTQDLMQMGAPTSMRLYEDGGKRAEFKLVGCQQVPGTNEYNFVISFASGKTCQFDILTGALRELPDSARN